LTFKAIANNIVHKKLEAPLLALCQGSNWAFKLAINSLTFLPFIVGLRVSVNSAIFDQFFWDIYKVDAVFI